MVKNNQDQCAGDNSTNIQAGGDVIIVGLTYNDVRQIADDVFKANFLMLQGEARSIAQQRAEELITSFLVELQKEKDIEMDAAKDPDMQYVLFTAQRDYARSGNKDLEMLLVDILVQRVKIGNDELKKIVLNEAIQIAPKLTIKQLNAISVRFLVASSMQNGIVNIETWNSYLKNHLAPFCAELAKENSDYQHIEYTSCGSVSIMQSNILDMLKKSYSGVLSRGFDSDDIKLLSLTPEQNNKIFRSCLRNDKKMQISAINDAAITTMAKGLGLTDVKILELINLQNKHLLSNEEIEQILLNADPKFSELLNVWNNSGLGRLQLTTVGIALAHANIKKTICTNLDLGEWIK